MITTRKAKIIDRTFFVTAECPTCGEEIMFELNYELGQPSVTVTCECCLEDAKVDIFDYFAVYN